MTDINDYELLKLEEINNWAAAQQGKSVPIDQFTKDLEEKFNEVGFTVEVKVYDTDQSGAYAFGVEITGRTADSQFDPDRMVHEVTSNLLELPGQDKGFIPSKEGIDRLVQREMSKNSKNHPKH